jgi:hypothetical protein
MGDPRRVRTGIGSNHQRARSQSYESDGLTDVQVIQQRFELVEVRLEIGAVRRRSRVAASRQVVAKYVEPGIDQPRGERFPHGHRQGRARHEDDHRPIDRTCAPVMRSP